MQFLSGWIRTVRCMHGEGLIGQLMEHGVGYLIEFPGEPSLYLAGDTLLTRAKHQPQVSVVPAGGARFDIGGEILMGLEEVLEFTRLSQGIIVANHLEAINHCPVTREELAQAAAEAGVGHRLFIPTDGQTLTLGCKPLPSFKNLHAE